VKYPVSKRGAIVLQLLMGAITEVWEELDQNVESPPAERHMRAGVAIYAYEVAEEAGIEPDMLLALFMRGGEIGRVLLADTKPEHVEVICTVGETLEEIEPETVEELITDPARLLPGKPDGGLN